ncbi:hypothetical protein JTB14_035769 [Gonioctena quinquepunctata]|nr:hypothetical protein JTB14_035769 [Gonioctena quinquepunctata]
MDKLLEMIKPNLTDLSKNNISAEQWQECSVLLKQRTQCYREENARLESVFKKLKILNNELKLLVDISDSLTKMSDIMQNTNTKSVTNHSIALSHTDRLRKHSNYVSKLKICIKMYMNLNERLTKEIKLTKWELDQAKQKLSGILNLSNGEIQQLEEKAKKYEKELLKFERKYPWLKDPDFNLPNISKEMDLLRNLKETNEKLAKELSVYQDLKPDIKEAAQQLADLKEENKKFSSKFLEANC